MRIEIDIDDGVDDGKKYVVTTKTTSPLLILNQAVSDVARLVNREYLVKSEAYKGDSESNSQTAIMIPYSWTGIEADIWREWQDSWGGVTEKQLIDVWCDNRDNNYNFVTLGTSTGKLVRVHALKFANGKIWDCINGWRK